MIHSQHTPHESRIVGAKHRFSNVVPWAEWDKSLRPPSNFIDTDDCIVTASEDVEIARFRTLFHRDSDSHSPPRANFTPPPASYCRPHYRMIRAVSQGRMAEESPHKKEREHHRQHILRTLRNVYPPLHTSVSPVLTTSSSSVPPQAEGITNADGTSLLETVINHQCDWADWNNYSAVNQETDPVGSDHRSPSDINRAADSLRCHMEDGCLVACGNMKTWRVAIPENLPESDAVFPTDFPRRPSKIYFHHGFCDVASQAGVELGAPHIASAVLQRLKTAEQASSAAALADGACSDDNICSSPVQSMSRRRRCFAYFLETVVDKGVTVLFGEGTPVLREHLNDEQRVFFDRVVEAVEKMGRSDPTAEILHLLCGRAGTGKTHVTAAIQHHLDMMGAPCAAMSFMWSAVFQMRVTCQKSSIHKFLDASIEDLSPYNLGTKDVPTRKVRALKDSVTGLKCLFVDEISTAVPALLFALDKYLRLALDPHKPFGGVMIILLGDFGQIPPIPRPCLAELLVLNAQTNRAGENGSTPEELVNAGAAALFSQFRKQTLTKAMRSLRDPAWSNLTAGFEISATGPPITEQTLESLKNMRLTREMVDKDPGFQFAVIATLTNFEAKVINNAQARRFAEALNEPVFRTVSGIKIIRGYSELTSEGYINMQPVGAFELEQFWVRGMPVVAREKPHGLDACFSIANGRAGFSTRSGIVAPRRSGAMRQKATTAALPLTFKIRLPST